MDNKLTRNANRQTGAPKGPEGPRIAVHPDVSRECLEKLQTILGALVGAVPLAVMPCHLHGEPATVIAAMMPAYPGAPEGAMGFAPLAVLFDSSLAESLVGPGGESLVNAVDGAPVARKRQAHDGVPLRTGQYL